MLEKVADMVSFGLLFLRRPAPHTRQDRTSGLLQTMAAALRTSRRVSKPVTYNLDQLTAAASDSEEGKYTAPARVKGHSLTV